MSRSGKVIFVLVLKPSLRLCPRPEGKPGPVEKYVWGGKAKVGLGPSPPPQGGRNPRGCPGLERFICALVPRSGLGPGLLRRYCDRTAEVRNSSLRKYCDRTAEVKLFALRGTVIVLRRYGLLHLVNHRSCLGLANALRQNLHHFGKRPAAFLSRVRLISTREN